MPTLIAQQQLVRKSLAAYVYYCDHCNGYDHYTRDDPKRDRADNK